MNITITQDNSRVEQLGNGANIIKKLYDLAIDPNNTLTLSGNISSTYAYGDEVDYLNQHYGPDFIVSATNRYIRFEDSAVLNALLSQGVGDGTGILQSQLDGLTVDGRGGSYGISFKNNTDITSFLEFKYFTNLTSYVKEDAFQGCSNLKWIAFPDGFTSQSGVFTGVTSCNIVVNSIEQYFNLTGGSSRLPAFGGSSTPDNERGCLYLKDKQHKIEDVVVPPLQSVPTVDLCRATIKTFTWEGDTYIPYPMCVDCHQLTTVNITGNCTRIGSAFGGCSQLTTVNGLSKITTFDGECFRNCRMLQIPTQDISNAEVIGAYAFQNVPISGELSFPNLTQIGDFAFNSSNISKVLNLGSITALGSAFNGCSNLTEIILPTTLVTIGGGAFAGKVQKLIMPYGVQTCNSVVDGANSQSYLYVQYPSTLTSIKFKGILYASQTVSRYYVIQATTPPTTDWNGNWNNGYRGGRPDLINWYVPDASLNTYKAATGWSEFASSIYPISQLETDSATYWTMYQQNKDYGVPQS